MKTEHSNRELRRQRRIKNQIKAYIILAVLLVAVIVVGSYGVRAIAKSVNDYTEKVNTVLEEATSSYEGTEEASSSYYEEDTDEEPTSYESTDEEQSTYETTDEVNN
jgi:Sec-independent protein translocase protein TatA